MKLYLILSLDFEILDKIATSKEITCITLKANTMKPRTTFVPKVFFINVSLRNSIRRCWRDKVLYTLRYILMIN